MFQLPLEVRIGEAYIYGDFDIEGEPLAVVSALHAAEKSGLFSAVGPLGTPGEDPYGVKRLLTLARLRMALPKDTEPVANGSSRRAAQLSGRPHSKDRDRAAVQYHYDAGNDFYKLWLGKRMAYSVAYYPTGTEDLNTAQDLKLQHMCHKLRLKPGDRLLDIGCGWGAFVTYAVQEYGVTALGITLSEQQYKLATQRIAQAGLSDRITIKLMDYRDLIGESFDKIVSIGMFEHVGRNQLPEYFRVAYQVLKPGCLFLNQGIHAKAGWARGGWTSLIERLVMGRGDFSMRYVFPDGEVIPVSELNLMAENAGFEVEDVENVREHWVYTLKDWLSGIENHKAEAIQAAGETIYRVFRIYLSASLVGFDSGNVNECQTLLSKLDNGRSHLPLNHSDLYT
jgi:cyclopropane-fatty-acyl-phospholipid synthase